MFQNRGVPTTTTTQKIFFYIFWDKKSPQDDRPVKFWNLELGTLCKFRPTKQKWFSFDNWDTFCCQNWDDSNLMIHRIIFFFGGGEWSEKHNLSTCRQDNLAGDLSGFCAFAFSLQLLKFLIRFFLSNSSACNSLLKFAYKSAWTTFFVRIVECF